MRIDYQSAMVDYSIWLEKDTWVAVWRVLKDAAMRADAAITQFGEGLVAIVNEIPGVGALTQVAFNLPAIPRVWGKWLGRAGVVVSGYGTYRGYQWLLDSGLNRKVAATESDLLPFLDLLKLQELRRGDYRDVLHFCIDRRFFVTQFPASPPSKFKLAVPALYDLIQTYGRDPAKQGVGVEAFLASDEVQSLFFEKEEDYKLIEVEFFTTKTKKKEILDIRNMADLKSVIENGNIILHLFDLPQKLNLNRTQLKPFVGRYALVIGRILSCELTTAGQPSLVVSEKKGTYDHVDIQILNKNFDLNNLKYQNQLNINLKDDFSYIFEEDSWCAIAPNSNSLYRTKNVALSSEKEFTDEDVWLILDEIQNNEILNVFNTIKNSVMAGEKFDVSIITKVKEYSRRADKFGLSPESICIFKIKRIS